MRCVPHVLDQTRTGAEHRLPISCIAVTTSQIIKIEGVFSGTLSYIFNEFSKVEGGDVKFSEVVKIAKDKGYTVSSLRFTRKDAEGSLVDLTLGIALDRLEC
jgi:hypothetical protein